ncbi:hypothetical protein niasHS_001660 [Heterodera schachtii]|uniref:DUF7516 domain-containing protein n=1 Tax=Heterodera schachtii TaxID=97005 RepID=A0ABD2KCD6_HETSC
MASSAVMLSTSERNNMGRERLLSCLADCGAEHEPVVLLELQKTYFNKYDEYLNKAELRKFFSKGHIKQVFENFMPKDVEMATDVNATGSLFIKMKRPLQYALADTPKSAPLMVPKTSNTEGVRSTLVPLPPPPPPAPPVEQPTAPPAPSRSKTAVTTADKFKVPSSVVPGHRLLPSNQKESFSFAAGGFGGGTNGGTSAAAQSSADDLFDDFVPRDGTTGGGRGGGAATRNNSETSTLVAYEGEEDIGGKAEPTATRKPSLTTGRQMTTMKPKRSFWDYDGDLDDDEGIGAGDNGGEDGKAATGKAAATAANNRDDANARLRHCRYRRDDITAVVDNNKNQGGHDDEDEEDNSSWGGDLLGDSALEDGYQQMKRQQQQQQQAAAAAAVVAAAVALNSNSSSDRAAVTASTGRGGERSNNNTGGSGGGFGNAPSAMRRVRVGLMGNTNGNNGVGGGDAGKKHGGGGNNRNGGDNDHDEEDGDGIKNNNAIDRTVGSLLEAKWAEERQARDALVAERLRNRKQRDETATTAPAAGAALFTLNSSNNNSKKVNSNNNNNDAAWCDDDDEDVEEGGRVVAKRNVGEGMKQRFGQQQQGKYNNNSGSFSNKVTKPNLYGGNARFRDVPPPPFAPNLMSSDDDEEEEEKEDELVKQYMTDKREKKPSAQPQQQQHEDGAVQQQKGKGTNAKMMAFDDEEEEEYDEEEEEEGPMMMMTQKKEGEEDNDGELDDGAHHHDTTSPEELQDEETEQFYQQFAGSTTSSSKLAAKSKKFSEDERNKYVAQFSVVMGMLQNVNHIEFDKALARLSTNGDYRKAFPSAADLLAFITVNCPNIKAIKVSKQDVALLWSERSDELVSLLLQHVGKMILKKSVGKAYDY